MELLVDPFVNADAHHTFDVAGTGAEGEPVECVLCALLWGEEQQREE
jgi:hypothetical protein